MPVRRLRQVELGEARMVERGDEHRRHPVERGAAFLGDRLQHRQRFEGFARVDHRGAVGQAAEVAHHHAEAVVERHRNAHPVARRQPDRLADEEAVVEDVVMRQGGALGVAGGARGELDVDRVVELQLLRQQRERGALVAAGRAQQVVEVEHAGRVVGAHADHHLQRRQAVAAQQAGLAVAQLGGELADHAEVVAALESGRQHERAAADLVQRVLELGEAVGGIDVDHHQAGLRGGELGQRPLHVVLRPDADAIAGLEAEPHQPAGERIDLLLEGGVGEAHVLVPHDDRLAFGVARAGLVEIAADGLSDERGAGSAVDITRGAHLVVLLLSFSSSGVARTRPPRPRRAQAAAGSKSTSSAPSPT